MESNLMIFSKLQAYLTSRGSAVRLRELPHILVKGFKQLEPFVILAIPTQFAYKGYFYILPHGII